MKSLSKEVQFFLRVIQTAVLILPLSLIQSCGNNQDTGSRIKRPPTPQVGKGVNQINTGGTRPRVPGDTGVPLDQQSVTAMAGTYRKSQTLCGKYRSEGTDYNDRKDSAAVDAEMSVKLELGTKSFRQTYSNSLNGCTLVLSYTLQSITDRTLALISGKAKVSNASNGLSLKECNQYFGAGSGSTSNENDDEDIQAGDFQTEIDYEYAFDSKQRQLIIVWGTNGYCSLEEADRGSSSEYDVDHDYYKKL